MATKKTKPVKKTAHKNVVRAPKSQVAELVMKLKKLPWDFLSKIGALVAIGLILFVLAQKYRGLVLAGIVNRSPIWRTQLNQQMSKRYGKMVMDEIVGNELIKQEAAKMQVSVTEAEIQEELKKLEEKIGGPEALKDALEQYGLTQSEIGEQIRLSLLQRKIVEKLNPAEITDEEIETYFKDNQAVYKGKKLDEVRGEIADNLKEQKLQEAFAKWFADIKASAQIEVYLD